MMTQGPRVLVTGSAKRIGRVIAIELSRRGFSVAIHYNTSRHEAEQVSRECNDAPIFQADLAKVEEIRHLFSDIRERFGLLDCLVNNAARFTRFDPLEITEQDWDFIHEVNLKATFFCCQEAAQTDGRNRPRPDCEHKLVGGHSPLGGARTLLCVEGGSNHAD